MFVMFDELKQFILDTVMIWKERTLCVYEL